jgi:hypothetical protein
LQAARLHPDFYMNELLQGMRAIRGQSGMAKMFEPTEHWQAPARERASHISE